MMLPSTVMTPRKSLRSRGGVLKSIGHRVLDQDFEFNWTKKKGAWYRLPNGKKVFHEIIGNCPYLTKDSLQALAVASSAGSVAVLAADHNTEFFNIHSDYEEAAANKDEG